MWLDLSPDPPIQHWPVVICSLGGHHVDAIQVGVGVKGCLAQGLQQVGAVRRIHHPQRPLAQVLCVERKG